MDPIFGFGLVEMEQVNCGELVSSYPQEDSPLLLKDFFNKLYARYDERFVYSAPDLKATTGRLEWSAESPVLNLPGLDYAPRIADFLLKIEAFRHVGSGKALADGELVEGHETPREEQRTGDSSRPKVRLLLALTTGRWIPFRE